MHTTKITIGDVKSAWPGGKLTFAVATSGGGNGHVEVYASDPSDLRKSGVVLVLGWDEWTALWGLINATGAELDRLRTAGYLTNMTPPR